MAMIRQATPLGFLDVNPDDLDVPELRDAVRELQEEQRPRQQKKAKGNGHKPVKPEGGQSNGQPEPTTNSLNSQFAASPPWPVMDVAALHGLAGEVVGTIEPHSEADPNAILIQFLAAFGNAVGDAPHYMVEGDRHGTKIFVVTSGETSKGRKGTA